MNNIRCDPILQVRYANILALASRLLDSSLANEGFLSKSDVHYSNGERVYGEMNRGQWWERTEASSKFPAVASIAIQSYPLLSDIIDYFYD